jgi:O-antigen/teichoic acid export membrane protein
LGLLALLTHRGLVIFALTVPVCMLIPVTANGMSVRRLMVTPPKLDFAIWRTLFKGGLPLLVLSGLVLIYGTVDIPLLERLTSSSVVGEYALAYRWVGIPVFVATIVVGATAPTLAAYAHEQSGRFADLANRSLRLVLIVAIPAATGIALIAADIIGLLYRNQGYGDSSLLIRILAVHIPLVAVSTVLATVLISADQQGRYVRVAIVAAIVNPLLTIGLIMLTKHTAHDGAIGAAIATVATEAFMIYGAFRIRPAGVWDRPTGLFALRCLLATMAMAIPLVLFNDLDVFVKIAIGVVLYAVASIAFRTVTPAHLRAGFEQFRGAAGRRGATTSPQPEETTHVLSDVG